MVGPLQTFRSEQNKKQLVFFEGISVFKGMKKQVNCTSIWSDARFYVESIFCNHWHAGH